MHECTKKKGPADGAAETDMIYIFTALYCEAHTLIRQLHLTKNQANTRFQEFYNEQDGIRLTITGVGEIAAATAVGSICTAFPPTEYDLLLNVGTCGHAKNEDGIFLCNQIFEQATGRSFYPDMLLRHDFREAAVVTGMTLWDTGPDDEAAGKLLYDMEAAAIYQAGAHFFGPHQMLFLKIVSDCGSADKISEAQVKRLMEQYGDCMLPLIGRLRELSGHEQQRNASAVYEREITERICLDLQCSKAMGDSLRKHLHYLALTGTDYTAVIENLYKEGMLPCKNKREGKRCFEELKRRLF